MSGGDLFPADAVYCENNDTAWWSTKSVQLSETIMNILYSYGFVRLVPKYESKRKQISRADCHGYVLETLGPRIEFLSCGFYNEKTEEDIGFSILKDCGIQMHVSPSVVQILKLENYILGTLSNVETSTAVCQYYSIIKAVHVFGLDRYIVPWLRGSTPQKWRRLVTEREIVITHEHLYEYIKPILNTSVASEELRIRYKQILDDMASIIGLREGGADVIVVTENLTHLHF
jgi:hypothetical protein